MTSSGAASSNSGEISLWASLALSAGEHVSGTARGPGDVWDLGNSLGTATAFTGEPRLARFRETEKNTKACTQQQRYVFKTSGLKERHQRQTQITDASLGILGLVMRVQITV